jgi:hypothetical protein
LPPGECAANIDGDAWAGGGGGVWAGESDGDNSELMSIATVSGTSRVFVLQLRRV